MPSRGVINQMPRPFSQNVCKTSEMLIHFIIKRWWVVSFCLLVLVVFLCHAAVISIVKRTNHSRFLFLYICGVPCPRGVLYRLQLSAPCCSSHRATIARDDALLPMLMLRKHNLMVMLQLKTTGPNRICNQCRKNKNRCVQSTNKLNKLKYIDHTHLPAGTRRTSSKKCITNAISYEETHTLYFVS